jgi:hypothetical protein
MLAGRKKDVPFFQKHTLSVIPSDLCLLAKFPNAYLYFHTHSALSTFHSLSTIHHKIHNHTERYNTPPILRWHSPPLSWIFHQLKNYLRQGVLRRKRNHCQRCRRRLWLHDSCGGKWWRDESTSQKLYVSTNTICKHNIPDILFLRSFNLNSTCSARGNVSYLFFFLRDKHTTFYGRQRVLHVSTIW